MSKIVTYRCNLCGTTSDHWRDLLGIFHTEMGVEGKVTPCIALRHAAQVEHHLCLPCARALLAVLPEAVEDHARGGKG